MYILSMHFTPLSVSISERPKNLYAGIFHQLQGLLVKDRHSSTSMASFNWTNFLVLVGDTVLFLSTKRGLQMKKLGF